MLSFSRAEALAIQAIFERLFPGDEWGPGAVELGACDYADRALAGACAEVYETYRLGLIALDRAATDRHGASLAAVGPAEQDALLTDLAFGQLPGAWPVPQGSLFQLFRTHLLEGLFADPVHGRNRDKRGWAFLRHPGIWLENTVEEALAPTVADKRGEIRSIADLHAGSPAPRPDAGTRAEQAEQAARDDGAAGTTPPTGPVDVVIIGIGAVGGLIAPVLARAGLRVVGLEAGPWRRQADYRLDELSSTHYGRASMSGKFMSEVPRWRSRAGAPEREPIFGLGKMMNGVGGSAVHYGGWLRRFHPHHFRVRTHSTSVRGANALPAGCTVTDWPIQYDDLEPY